MTASRDTACSATALIQAVREASLEILGELQAGRSPSVDALELRRDCLERLAAELPGVGQAALAELAELDGRIQSAAHLYRSRLANQCLHLTTQSSLRQFAAPQEPSRRLVRITA
jgi:hypothetical protein